MESSSVFDPQSELARSTVDLFNVTLVVSAVIFVLVSALVFYCLIRFRSRAGHPEPRQVGGNKRLEIAWTIAPVLVLIYLFVLTVTAMHKADPPKGQDKEPDIIVIGHQFWWEIRYPERGVVTANEVHIPTGRPVLVHVGSADVIHSFWVPQLGRKMDMLPEQMNAIWLASDRPGVFWGSCSEFCGVQHAWMRIRVVAETPAAFEAWLRHRQQPALPPATPETARGARLFRELTCINCHTIRGVAGGTTAGPDLTHVASRAMLGAGVLDNTAANLANWIRNSQAHKPGNLMPNMHVTDAQLRDVMAYLETLQ